MQGYNTIIAAVTAAAAAVIGWMTGQIPGDQMFMAVWALSLVVFARIGIDLNVGGWLAGYKTYLDAIGGMIASVGAWANGQLNMEQLVTALVMGFLAIFYRKGIKKAVNGPGNE